MKKAILKIIGGIITALLILQSNLVIAAYTSSLQSQQSENNKKITEAQSHLQDVQEEKSEAVKEVESLSSKITEYQTQIDELNTQIEELNTKIKNAEEKINKAEEDYKEKEELLNARLVATYEAGDTSYLDFILSSESITDLISNYYLVSEIATNDAELLEKIQKEKEEIEEAKKTLEESKQQLDTSKESKQTVSEQLQVAKKEKDAQVANLSSEEKQIEEKIEELQAANAQISKEIKVAQAKYAAQIAALNKNSNSGSSSSSSSGGTYTGGGSGVLQRPVSSGSITAGMYYSSGRYHGALDYGVSAETPVYAAADGVVIYTANLTSSYGTHIIIQHANNLQTLYAHGTSGSICVSPGQTVSRGQQIMLSGDTGNSSGPHLHFEVRVAPYDYDTCRVDPRNYF